MQTAARSSDVHGIANERKQARPEPKPIEQHHDRRQPTRVGHIRLVVVPRMATKYTPSRSVRRRQTKNLALSSHDNQVEHAAILSRFGVAGIYMV